MLEPYLASGRPLDRLARSAAIALPDAPLRAPIPRFAAPASQAGFPSPAADYIEEQIDINAWLIRNPPATFVVRVQGESMMDMGILSGDLVTVDRSITPRGGKVVVAAYDGTIYIKLLRKLGVRFALCSQNERRAADYPPLYLDQAQDCTIWGVVTGVVRRL